MSSTVNRLIGDNHRRAGRDDCVDLRKKFWSDFETFPEGLEVRRWLAICAAKRLPIVITSTVDRGKRCIGMNSRSAGWMQFRYSSTVGAVLVGSRP